MNITTLTSSFMPGVTVNAYLLQCAESYFLVDTGAASQRRSIELKLQAAGCAPGKLKLIFLTHGDFDHIGNAAYLRKQYGARIAMNAHDAGMGERSDMFWNRKSANRVMGWLINHLLGLRRSDRFTPDLHLVDGQDLAEYGLPARVLGFPGHSLGSIGILTADGDLFCGDLLDNTQKPGMGSIIDDRQAMVDSAARLQSLALRSIYPGHGRPFTWQELLVATG